MYLLAKQLSLIILVPFKVNESWLAKRHTNHPTLATQRTQDKSGLELGPTTLISTCACILYYCNTFWSVCTCICIYIHMHIHVHNICFIYLYIFGYICELDVFFYYKKVSSCFASIPVAYCFSFLFKNHLWAYGVFFMFFYFPALVKINVVHMYMYVLPHTGHVQ